MVLRRAVMVGAILLAGALPTGWGQEGPLSLTPLNEAPPEGLAPAIAKALAPKGWRVLDSAGKPFLDLWLRAGVPASGKYVGPVGEVLYPVLKNGELLAAARYVGEGHDYRDQTIEKGVYTLRYGLRRVDGNHQGTSTYRDFALLVAAAQDKDLTLLPLRDLETVSAEAAGTNHPAVLMLVAPPDGQKAPGVAHQADMNLWGAVLPLPLVVPNEAQTSELPVQLIVVGAAPA